MVEIKHPTFSRKRIPKSGLRNNRCGLCGGNYPHQGTCPAQGKKCLNCGKMNHFSKVCRGKPNNRSKSSRPKKTSRGEYHVRSADVEESPSSEMSSLVGVDSDNSEEYTFNIGAQGHEAGKPIFRVTIMNTPIRIMADSGATVNILCKRDFDGLKSKPQLVETNAKVYPYMSDKPLTLCGKSEPLSPVVAVHPWKHSMSQRVHQAPYLAGQPHKH